MCLHAPFVLRFGALALFETRLAEALSPFLQSEDVLCEGAVKAVSPFLQSEDVLCDGAGVLEVVSPFLQSEDVLRAGVLEVLSPFLQSEDALSVELAVGADRVLDAYVQLVPLP